MNTATNFSKDSDFDRTTVQLECPTHGLTNFTKMVIFGREHDPYCDQCAEDRKEANRIAEIEQARQQRINARIARLANNGIDAKAAGFSAWEYDSKQLERQQKMIAALQRYADGFNSDLPNILLIGGTGSGKTMLANAIARRVFDKNYKPDLTPQGYVQRRFADQNPAKLIRSAEIIRQIKATWTPDSHIKDDDLYQQWAAHQLLIIDDLGDADAVGKEQAAADDRNRISQVLNMRYQVSPTIITTNLNQDGVASFLGDRAWDRLQEKLVVVECNWASYRKNHAKVSYL